MNNGRPNSRELPESTALQRAKVRVAATPPHLLLPTALGLLSQAAATGLQWEPGEAPIGGCLDGVEEWVCHWHSPVHPA